MRALTFSDTCAQDNIFDDEDDVLLTQAYDNFLAQTGQDSDSSKKHLGKS